MRYPKGTKDRKFNFKNQKVEQKKIAGRISRP